MYPFFPTVRPGFLEDDVLRERCRGRRILVLGGDGFLGSYVASALRLLSAEVSIVSRRPSSPMAWNGIRVHRGHLLERELMEKVFAGQEIVFDLAGSSGAVDSNQDPLRNLSEECEPHLNAFQIASAQSTPPLLVFCSSRTVYGKPRQLPVSEQHPLAPESVYAIHKLTLEQYLQHFGQRQGLPFLIFRLSNPYGPLMAPANRTYGVLNRFILRALRGEPIRLFGDGSQRRDYIHVDDVVEAFIRAAVTPACRNQILNLGGPSSIAMRDAVRIIVDACPGSEVTHEDWPPDYFAVETGDYQSDVEKLGRLTGKLPTIEFADGIRRTLAAYRAHGVSAHESSTRTSTVVRPSERWTWVGKRVLVTGASGFIGGHLTHRLLSLGAVVGAVHRRPLSVADPGDGRLVALPADLDGVRGVPSPLRDFKPKVIFHLAARPDGAESPEHAEACLRTNVLPTVNLLEFAKEIGVEAFVYAGSAKLYGNSPVPHRENSKAEPLSSYAASKLAAWNCCHMYAHVHGVPAVGLNSTLVYGPTTGINLFTFLAKCLRAGKLEIELSGGLQTRDPLHLDDAIDAYLNAAIHASELKGRAIPIGGGREGSVKELAELFIRMAGFHTPVRVCNTRIRETETLRSYCDNAEAKKALHWEPKVTLEEGLRRTAMLLLGSVPEQTAH